MRDIGKNIRYLRQLKKMTQDELAERLFVTRQTVSNYETGKSRPDIEMLIRIAQTLDTDPNTVLYGIPKQENRERKIFKLCLSLAVLIIVWIGFSHLAALAKRNASTTYDMRLYLACIILLGPMVAFWFGWTVMQGISVFSKLSPLRMSWKKRIWWIVFGIAIAYLLVSVPIFSSYFVHSAFADWLPDVIWRAWGSAVYWILGYTSNMYIRPNILLFWIFGCGIWLCSGEKTKDPQ